MAAVRADPTLRGADFCGAYTAAADRWLTEVFAAATAPAERGGDGLALVAVGGYGRGELCPQSDLDLILLHRGRRDRKDLARTAERIWYPLWDGGLKLGHAPPAP